MPNSRKSRALSGKRRRKRGKIVEEIPKSLSDLYFKPGSEKFRRLIKFWNKNVPCPAKICSDNCSSRGRRESY